MAGGPNFTGKGNQKTLSDWVKDFQIKKTKMKRKLRRGRAELRVCAILATALRSAEKELRQEQEERYNRWSDLQSKLMQSNTSKKEEEEKRKKEISELWKHEISSLDEFMRNMSSRSCVAAN